MRPILLLPVLFLFFLQLKAQYASFPIPGVEYGVVYDCNPFDCYNYLRQGNRYDGDTVLCGKVWNRFLRLPDLHPNFPAHVREENGKYYVLINDCTEYLYFDFTKNTGDTVLTVFGSLLVTSIGTHQFTDGVVRKKMILDRLGAQYSPYQFTWVDGVGDLKHGLFPSYDWEGGYSHMVCLHDSAHGDLHFNPIFNLDCPMVLCPEPKALFDVSCAGRTVTFNNTSRDAFSYVWYFGDGQTSTEVNPTHTYDLPGCYAVRLVAHTDCYMDSSFTTQNLKIDAPVYWDLAPNQTPGGVYDIEMIDEQRGYTCSGNTLWKTVDGGVQWTPVFASPVSGYMTFDFYDFEHGLVRTPMASGGYALAWTDDAGQNWTPHFTNQPMGQFEMEMVNDSTAFLAADDEGLWITKNNGADWVLHDSIADYIKYFDAVTSVDGSTAYIVGARQFHPFEAILGKSTDMTTWTFDTFPASFFRSLKFITPELGWAIGSGAVLKTENGGVSWTPQIYLNSWGYHLDFVDATTGWYCGHNTGIFGTIDGGETWTQQTCPRTEQRIQGLTAVSNTTAFALAPDGLLAFSTIPDTVTQCLPTVKTKEPNLPLDVFELSPNPATDQIAILWAEPSAFGTELVVYNINNLQVLTLRESDGPVFSITGLQPGIYLVRALKHGIPVGRAKKLVVVR